MADSKIDFTFENLHFSCEGDNAWVEKQLNNVLSRIPALLPIHKKSESIVEEVIDVQEITPLVVKAVKPRKAKVVKVVKKEVAKEPIVKAPKVAKVPREKAPKIVKVPKEKPPKAVKVPKEKAPKAVKVAKEKAPKAVKVAKVHKVKAEKVVKAPKEKAVKVPKVKAPEAVKVAKVPKVKVEKVVKAPKEKAPKIPKATKARAKSKKKVVKKSPFVERTDSPLYQFISEKKAEKNQVRKFLAAAVYLTRNDDRLKLSTPVISMELKSSGIAKLQNASDCLNKNEKKGYCIKEGKGFVITENGFLSIG